MGQNEKDENGGDINGLANMGGMEIELISIEINLIN